MSEPMFRGGPPSPEPQAAEPAESRSNRKALYLIGGVVGALVLAGGAFLLLNGSSSSSDDAGTVAGGQANANQPATVKPPAAVVVKPATVNISARDPFAPVYTAPVVAQSPAANPSTPSTPAAPSTPNAPVVTTPTTPPVTLAVLSINTNGGGSATITVNGKKYSNTKVGATFGTYYTLYSVFNPQCVGLLYGDQNVPVCLSRPATVTP